MLYQVLQRHLATFLERADEAGGLPKFVVDELRAYLDRGILAHGFARVRCTACGHDRLLAFSCKGRGFCPSCGGRRMADTAAYLTDSVLVDVPVRQWVLTLPHWLRRCVAYDKKLASAILRAFTRRLHGRLRARAFTEGDAGSVTVIQRWGGALNLNPHFHTLAPDGVYVETTNGVEFRATRHWTAAEIEALLADVVRATQRILEARGIDGPDEEVALDACAAASVGQRRLLDAEAGKPIERQPGDLPSGTGTAHLLAAIDGFTLHADVRVEATQPDALERLARYIARPAIAQDRLRLLDGDRVALDFRHPWRDGTWGLVFDPLDFIARLAALVPPPRANLVRYHGVFASAHRLRPLLVRAPQEREAMALSRAYPKRGKAHVRRRLTWAALMQRVFGIDVLECPKCEGRARIIAFIEDPVVIRRILTHLGLPTASPPLAPARGPPQLDLDV